MNTEDPIYMTFLHALLQPPETPFERTGRDKRGHWFIYMTNRQAYRWSLLFAASAASNIMRQALQDISMGYTQLWMFEKRYVAAPRGEVLPQEREPTYQYEARYPQSLDRRDWAGRLFVVLREPLPQPVHDVVSYHTREAAAIQAADRYARQQGRRAVVGLMQADETWH